MNIQLSSLEDLEQLFATKMHQYEEKLQKATSGAVPAHPELSSLASEFSDFKCFVWQALNKFKSQLESLSCMVDRHETSMRRKVLLIHGVPETKDEKLLSSTYSVLTTQMKLSEASISNSIHICHRLGSSQRKARPILVRFFNMEHRQLVWDSKKTLKGSGITVSEFLTATRHQIFTEARKHFGINNCWSMEGKILIITSDKVRRKVETVAELRQLTARFPSGTGDAEDSAQSEEPGSPKPVDLPVAKGTRKARRRN